MADDNPIAEPGKTRSYRIATAKENTPAFPLVLTDDAGGEHKFTYYPDRVPGSVLIDLPGMAVSADSQPMWHTFEVMMDTGDFMRFKRLMQSPAYKVTGSQLAGMLQDMVSDAAELPT